jgi:hypothetical protein
MNPLNWNRADHIALALTACMGAAFGIPLGYIVYAAEYASDSVSFGYWLSSPIQHDVFQWAIYGALIAASVFYVLRLAGSNRN